MADCPPKPARPVPDPLDRTVCFCHSVTGHEIVAAIEAGAACLADIQAETLASTGCGGCGEEILELLNERANDR